MNSFDIGGRGKIAPYKSKLMRVPCPLEEQVSEMKNRYCNYLKKPYADINKVPRFLKKKYIRRDDRSMVAIRLTNLIEALELDIHKESRPYIAQVIEELKEIADMIG